MRRVAVQGTATPATARMVGVVAAAAALLFAAVVPVAATTGGGERVEVIVLLADDDASGAHGRAVARDHGVALRHRYGHAVSGIAGSVPAARLAQLQRDRRVALVERDARVETASVPTGIERIGALDNPALPIVPSAEVTGRVDATVAILDTGIDPDHPDLDVVHEWGCNTISTGPPSQRGTTCASGAGYGHDVTGHGTHVAGTVAAFGSSQAVVGVAPGAQLWSVRVLGTQGGSVSDLLAGIDHVTANADHIDVANMSLGGAFTSTALDDAIAASVAAGVTYVLAAGNDAMDVAGYSPAGHPDALTVAALADYDGQPGGLGLPTCGDHGADDDLATFSNHGDGVDLLAPGACIRSSARGGGTSVASGTSMAAPHVAGAAALLASADHGGPAAIRAAIVGAGSDDWGADTWPQAVAPRLLDVHDHAVFAPGLVGGEDDDGSDDDDPGDGDPGDDPGDDEPGDDPGDDDPGDDQPGTGELVVGLTGGWSSARGQWTSWVDVAVHDADGAVAGAVASVIWSPDGGTPAEGDRCTTGSDGTCRVTGPTLPNREKSVTYAITHLDAEPVDVPPLTVTRD